MNIKKISKEISEYVDHNGFILESQNDEAYYVIHITHAGEWSIEQVDGELPASIIRTESQIAIPLPQYEDELDHKEALMLDLMFILSDWVRSIPYIKGAQKTNKNYSTKKRKEAAKKAWETRKKT